jgi:predicted DNA-binding protein YlxM (UPF0122 family)
MEIRRIDIETLSEASTSVFLSNKWLSIYDENLEPYGIFKGKSGMIGGFVLYKQKRSGITYYRNPMYMPTVGLFFVNTTKNKSKKLSENKKVMKAISDFLSNLSYGVLSIYLPYNHIDMQPFFWEGFKVVPNYTYHIDLSLSMDEIAKDYATERRSVMKKAIKDEVNVQISYDYKLVKDLVLNTFSRKEKQIDVKILDKILFQFADRTNSFAFVSYQNERPISASFCIYDKNKVYYLLGGYDKDYKHQGAGAMGINASIEHSKSLGIPIFDFEGSMLPEVEKYFRGFGGDLVPYYSINKAMLPLEMALKFINRSQF